MQLYNNFNIALLKLVKYEIITFILLLFNMNFKLFFEFKYNFNEYKYQSEISVQCRIIIPLNSD